MNEKQIVMRPIDVVILLKKITHQGIVMNGKQLADSLCVSAAEVSVAMERNRIAQLVDESKSRVNILALRDFLVYGIRYCFPAKPGSIVRGVPTASSAGIIKQTVATNGEQYVWKNSLGTERGQSIIPLYPKASEAARKDTDLYALLVIVDSLRIGKARERNVAIEELDKYLNRYASIKQ
ncbi:MAG: hypothetical protein J5977_11060 [Fibrobacter sp.]|nr:hypothetical protein [Fibrobacter sp.]